MTSATWNIRKRVKKLYDEAFSDEDVDEHALGYIRRVIEIVDEEFEAEAEREFTKSIKPVEFPK